MEVEKKSIIEKFHNNSVVFRVPVFQRHYSWQEEHCEKLMSDIKKIIGTENHHFMGTLVLMPTEETSFSEYVVIDGQQRLLTLMLVLYAIFYKAGNGDLKTSIGNEYIFNTDHGNRIKIKAMGSDDTELCELLNNSQKLDLEHNISKNFKFIDSMLARWYSDGISAKEVFLALQKLDVVEISLEKEKDDPQIIFESINSTGLPLKQTDLIRNYLFMKTPVSKQEEYWQTYWADIEKLDDEINSDQKSKESLIDSFFYTYITFKKGHVFNRDKLYREAIGVFSALEIDALFEDIKKYLHIYKDMLLVSDKYTSGKTFELLEKIKSLDQKSIYTFLMHVFDDYEKDNIKFNLNEVLKLMLVYIVRHLVCRGSKSFGNFFPPLYKRIFNNHPERYEKYDKSINGFLFQINSDDAMPSDDVFVETLKTKNLYSNNKKLCFFILSEMENDDITGKNGKEKLDMTNITIEHVMPQHLGKGWTRINKEEHQIYCHCLGNLTLTGLNSELSNSNFAKKQKILKDCSKIKELNRLIINKKEWGIEQIKNRSKKLAEKFCDLYSVPKTKEKIISDEDENIEEEY